MLEFYKAWHYFMLFRGGRGVIRDYFKISKNYGSLYDPPISEYSLNDVCSTFRCQFPTLKTKYYIFPVEWFNTKQISECNFLKSFYVCKSKSLKYVQCTEILFVKSCLH